MTATISRRGLALIVLAAVLWGTTGLSSRLLGRVATADALSVGLLRLLIAAPAMLLIARWQAPGAGGAVMRRSWRALLLFGAGVAGYNACFFAAIERTSVTAATLLALCTAPLFVALLARLFLREPLTRPVLAALGLGLAGTVLLVGGQGGRDLLRADYALGNLLALGAAFSYASYSLVGRAKVQEHPPTMVAALAFAVAPLLLAPLVLARGMVLPTSGVGWGLMLYLGLVATAVAYLVYIVGLREVPATVASIATLVEPLTATLLAALFLGERLTPLSVCGALLLLGSLALLSRGGHTRARRVPAPEAVEIG